LPDDVSGKIGLDTTEWKTGVSDINRDVRVIESGFKAVAAGMDDWSKSADGLSARNSALTEIIGKQQQKVALLQGEYDRMKQAAADNGDETERTAAALQDFEIKINKAKEQLAKSETELRKNSTALDTMEKGTGEASKGTENLADKTKDAEKNTISFTDSLKKAGQYAAQGFAAAAKAAAAAVAAIGTATVAATKQAFDFAKGAGEMADNVNTLSQQTGVSAEQLQKWQYASNFVDVSVETMTGSMAKLVKQMGSGNKAFDTLGVSIRDKVTGELRDSEAVFADAIDALGGIANETERDALSMELFGKKAQDLNPLIKAGGDTLRQLGEEAVQMGTVFNDNALTAMGAFDDSMQKFNATGEGMKNVIGMTVMPMFQPLVDTATGAMAQISTALQDGLQPGEFETITQNIIGTLQQSLTGITQIVTDAVPLVLEGLNAVMSALITALHGLLETLLPAAMSLLQGLIDGITGNLNGFIALAVTLVTTLAEFLIQNVPTLLKAAIAILQGIIDGIIDSLPELIPLAVQMLVELALALVDAIPNLVAALPQIIAAIVDGLLKVDWLDVGFKILTGIITGLINTVGSLLSSVWDIANQIVGVIFKTDWGEIGKNLLNGITDGMSNIVSTVKEKVTGFFKNIWDGVKSFFGIHSPSTVAAEDGKNIMRGMQDGMQNAQPSAMEKVKGVFKGIWDGIKSIFGFGSGGTDAAEAKKTGEEVTKGVADGVSGAGGTAEKSVKDLSARIIDLFRVELGVSGSGSTKTRPFGENAARGIIDGLQSMLSGLRSAAQEIGNAISDGIAQGIKNGTNEIITAAKKAATSALSAAKSQLGIHSPSRVMAEQVGLPAIQGIAQGLQANAGLLKKSMQNIAGNLTVKVGNVQPITVPGKASGAGKTILSAILQVDRRTLGQVVFELADEGQGFAASNQTRHDLGVVLV